ncbi:MAG: hypothetical protein ABFD82_22605 [Syntrophaceae bacterium]
MDAISKHMGGVLREGSKVTVGDTRGESVLIDGRLLKPNDMIHELVNIVYDQSDHEAKKDPEIIVIDGRVYERVVKEEDKMYDLVDIVERGHGNSPQDLKLDDNEILKRVSEVTEKIAREMIPSIAERVIREEIEKLKK